MRFGARIARIDVEPQKLVPGQAGFAELAIELAGGREHGGIVLRPEPAEQVKYPGTIEIGHWASLLACNMHGPRRCSQRGPLSSNAVWSRSAVLDERAVAQLGDRLLELGLRVHHDRAVPGDGFLDRLAGDEQEAHAFVAGLHGNLVATVEHDERPVADALAHERLALRGVLFGEHAERF